MRVKPLLALLLLFCALPLSAARSHDEAWMGVYFGKSKIGYTNFLLDKADYKGQPGYRLTSTMKTKMVVLGMDVAQDMDTTVYLNERFEPVYEEFKMSSGGRATSVTATFGKEKIDAVLTSQGVITSKSVIIPSGTKIVADSTYSLEESKLKVGDKSSFFVFNPLTISLDPVSTEVTGREEVTMSGKKYNAFVVKSDSAMGDMTCWQDENGVLLKAVGLMGITMIREPKDVAKSEKSEDGTYTPPTDLAVMTSARTSTVIPEPRNVKYLKLRLSDFHDKSFIRSDARQSATSEAGDNLSAVYVVNASELDVQRSVTLPVNGYDDYLGESAYVQPRDPRIKEAAESVVGSEKSTAKIVSLLRGWVYENMSANGEIGIIRPSVDILATKSGVCRDYAVLYTALARAAGVPTRLVAGLVYWEGGFYYHAWAESYVGEWVSVDSTLPSEFVDATHIKLTEGDASAMFDIVKTVGTIKAEVIEFR